MNPMNLHTYSVWRAGYEDYDEVDYRTVDSPKSAAVSVAEHDHAHRSGSEWHWPVTYIVDDGDGNRWSIEVSRYIVPEFEAGEPRKMS